MRCFFSSSLCWDDGLAGQGWTGPCRSRRWEVIKWTDPARGLGNRSESYGSYRRSIHRLRRER